LRLGVGSVKESTRAATESIDDDHGPAFLEKVWRMKLLNRCAVVTGGASGIGEAIAVAFAEEGADVAILDLNDAEARRVVERLRSTGRKAHFISCDVGDSAQVRSAFTQVDALFGKVDILVNNAGIIRLSPVLETSEAEWDLILRTNLKSVFLCSQEAARRMVAAGNGGRIICVSSIHAVLSEPNAAHYTASKGGMEAFARTLASELAPHRITVNYIRPGAVHTALNRKMYTPAVMRATLSRMALKEIAVPEWIAPGAVFLASDDARFMTGQHLTLDGGYIMDGSLPEGAEFCRD
jgi:NAD(P)-dependent dehydrogenase (short-subunit alcohol dehydrogenase family)